MQLLKAKDVAFILNLSSETILKMARENRVPHYHVGNGSVRFKQEDVETLLENARRDVDLKSPAPIDPRQMELPFNQDSSPV
jgi:excisionase family DNA binding protein